MSNKTIAAVLLATLLALAPGLGVRAAEHEDAAAPAPEPEKPRVVSVRQALTQPGEYEDERVLIVGMFMGFNGACNSAQPVGAGDTMIQDKQGLCIYVNGPLSAAFDPFERKGLGQAITLSGYVIAQEQGPPFFLVPYNKKSQHNNAYNAHAVLRMRKAQQNGQIQLYPLEQLLRSPDKYIEKPVVVKGLATQNPDACTAMAPAPAQQDQISWIMGTADGRCLRIVGSEPEFTESDSEPQNRLITVKGYLYLNDDQYVFLEVDEQPVEEKKTVIKMNGASSADEDSTAPGAPGENH